MPAGKRAGGLPTAKRGDYMQSGGSSEIRPKHLFVISNDPLRSGAFIAYEGSLTADVKKYIVS